MEVELQELTNGLDVFTRRVGDKAGKCGGGGAEVGGDAETDRGDDDGDAAAATARWAGDLSTAF